MGKCLTCDTLPASHASVQSNQQQAVLFPSVLPNRQHGPLRSFIQCLQCQSNLSKSSKWYGLGISNFTLCQWLMMGHLSKAISC